MKYLVLTLVFAAGFLAAHLTGSIDAADQKAEPAKANPNVPPPNPNIDMVGYLTGAREAAKARETRRLSEDDFLKMSREEGVIVLDARSKEMYDILHIKGAVNLSFPNIDVESLKKVLPDKNAKILIYCNNNFTPATGARPTQGNKTAELAREAMRPKQAISSLNISTYISLHSYGYKNVYELAPTLDPAKTRLELVSNKK
jgi:phage shock protein E